MIDLRDTAGEESHADSSKSEESLECLDPETTSLVTTVTLRAVEKDG